MLLPADHRARRDAAAVPGRVDISHWDVGRLNFDFHTGPVEVEHGSLAVCCCPQTIVPGETRLRLRAVGDRDARERAVLASVAPARRAHGDSAILEFSGVSCAPGEPSLVAEALGANALGATFRAAIAPGPTSCRTVVHDQATVLAYVAPGV